MKAPLIGLGLAALCLAQAAAAPATPEEAARLKALFERYVGAPAPGEAGSVAVVPEGESYRVTLDVKRALRGLEGFGFSVEPYSSASLLTPLPDGTWRVTSTDSPPLTGHFKDQTFTFKTASAAFEGVYDPAIYGFRRETGTYTGYVLSQTAPNLVQTRSTDTIAFTLDGTPAEAGTLAAKLHYLSTGIKTDMVFSTKPPGPASDDGPAAPPMAPFSISYAAPSSVLDVGFDRLHAKELLDLWAFLVAHPGADQLKASQDEFRGALRAALPVLGGLTESASLDAMTATTPVGPVSAKTLSGSLALAGFDGTASLSTRFALAALKVPADQLPAWVRGFVPTDLSLDVSTSGFRPADAASEAVNDFDLRAERPFSPEQSGKILHLLMPGPATVRLAPSRIASALLDLTLQGEATLADTPTGQVTITAKGMDAAIEAVQAASTSDPVAQQALGPLLLARNLGKPGSDGTLVWLIEANGDAVTVNGTPMK